MNDVWFGLVTHPAFWPLLFGVLWGLSFARDWRYERKIASGWQPDRAFSIPNRITQASYPLMGLVLLFCTLLFLTFTTRRDPQNLLEAAQELLLPLLLLLVVYSALVLLALPLLRRLFTARACAALWGLPSVAAYFFLLCCGAIAYVRPRWILRLPVGVAPWVAGVWLAGAAAVLGWKFYSHLRFRHRLLRDARPVEDRKVLFFWEQEQTRIQRETPIPLLISPAISSPLTIGLFSFTLRTVLPDRDYTQEELTLIFRHELRHVQRRDVNSKAFYALCQALCWFDPLISLAADRACADLEFACDEMVLYSADEETRQRYAGLLLTGAEEDTGLSTCLSASGEALRRRLQAVVEPPARRLSGVLLMGVVTALLVLCVGQVAISTHHGTMEEVLFSNYENCALMGGANDWEGSPLRQALGAIPVSKISSLHGAPLQTSYGAFSFGLKGQDRQLILRMYEEGYLEVYELRPDGLGAYRTASRALYTIDGPVDYAQLNGLMEGGTPDG